MLFLVLLSTIPGDERLLDQVMDPTPNPFGHRLMRDSLYFSQLCQCHSFGTSK